MWSFYFIRDGNARMYATYIEKETNLSSGHLIVVAYCSLIFFVWLLWELSFHIHSPLNTRVAKCASKHKWAEFCACVAAAADVAVVDVAAAVAVSAAADVAVAVAAAADVAAAPTVAMVTSENLCWRHALMFGMACAPMQRFSLCCFADFVYVFVAGQQQHHRHATAICRQVDRSSSSSSSNNNIGACDPRECHQKVVAPWPSVKTISAISGGLWESHRVEHLTTAVGYYKTLNFS